MVWLEFGFQLGSHYNNHARSDEKGRNDVDATNLEVTYVMDKEREILNPEVKYCNWK